MGSRGAFTLAFILGALGALPQNAAGAAELVVLSNPGAMPGLRELGAAFSRETGHTVTIIQEGVPEVERRLAANEPGDLISANPPGIVGELPGFLNKPCLSTIALLPSSKAPEAAREFIKFISSPRAAPLLRKTLVEPANP